MRICIANYPCHDPCTLVFCKVPCLSPLWGNGEHGPWRTVEHWQAWTVMGLDHGPMVIEQWWTRIGLDCGATAGHGRFSAADATIIYNNNNNNNNSNKYLGKCAKSAARPPEILPVLPMASLPLLMAVESNPWSTNFITYWACKLWVWRSRHGCMSMYYFLLFPYISLRLQLHYSCVALPWWSWP